MPILISTGRSFGMRQSAIFPNYNGRSLKLSQSSFRNSIPADAVDQCGLEPENTEVSNSATRKSFVLGIDLNGSPAWIRTTNLTSFSRLATY